MQSSIVGVLIAIIGLAIIAVLVSKQAQTTGVLSALGKGFSGSLSCAVSPILGGGQGACGTTSSSTITF